MQNRQVLWLYNTSLRSVSVGLIKLLQLIVKQGVTEKYSKNWVISSPFKCKKHKGHKGRRTFFFSLCNFKAMRNFFVFLFSCVYNLMTKLWQCIQPLRLKLWLSLSFSLCYCSRFPTYLVSNRLVQGVWESTLKKTVCLHQAIINMFI